MNLPILRMTIAHQQMILECRKCSTLRNERFGCGIYRMIGRVGAGEKASRGCCEVLDSRQVWRKDFDDAGWQRLAQDEGYDTVKAFEVTLRRLHYGAFLRGEKPMWLHEIRAAKETP